MWIADKWKDYEVIDCSGGEKIKDHNGWKLATVWGIGYKFEVK